MLRSLYHWFGARERLVILPVNRMGQNKTLINPVALKESILSFALSHRLAMKAFSRMYILP